jgi:hypothetical protein
LSEETAPLGAYVRAHHPGLTPENHQVTSPKDPSYNCIAHAIFDTTTFWQPGGVEGTAWPEGIGQSDDLSSWREFFELQGFRPCADGTLEQGFVKVAIYALEGEGMHVARQLPGGRWTSKLGQLQDIEHELTSLEDSRYGSIAVFMRRALDAS